MGFRLKLAKWKHVEVNAADKQKSGPDWSISTAAKWIGVKVCTDMASK